MIRHFTMLHHKFALENICSYTLSDWVNEMIDYTYDQSPGSFHGVNVLIGIQMYYVGVVQQVKRCQCDVLYQTMEARCTTSVFKGRHQEGISKVGCQICTLRAHLGYLESKNLLLISAHFDFINFCMQTCAVSLFQYRQY